MVKVYVCPATSYGIHPFAASVKPFDVRPAVCAASYRERWSEYPHEEIDRAAANIQKAKKFAEPALSILKKIAEQVRKS